MSKIFKIFTDEDGEQFETIFSALDDKYKYVYLVKPVVKEAKLLHALIFRDTTDPHDDLIFNHYDFTPDQARAVEAAIKAVMEFITTENIAKARLNQDTVIKRAIDAREALTKGE